jgi:hypothetical protein
MELLIAKLNNVFAFEYVPQFVLVLMNVKRRVERVDFFDDGERSAVESEDALTMSSASLNWRRSPPSALTLKPRACSTAQL